MYVRCPKLGRHDVDLSYLVIIGSPGVGKSVATEIYASIMTSRGNAVTWPNFRRNELTTMVQLVNGKSCASLLPAGFQPKDLEKFDSHEYNSHIIIIDGFRSPSEYPECGKLLATCRWVVDHDNVKGKLIIASSQAALGKISSHSRRTTFHKVSNRKITDYERAITDDVLFASIMENLDASLSDGRELATDLTVEKRIELLKAKYHYAGGIVVPLS